MKYLCCVFLVIGAQAARAQLDLTGPTDIDVTGGGRYFTLTDIGGKQVKWRYNGVTPSVGTCSTLLVVVPTSGTTPSAVTITANPNVAVFLQPGGLCSQSVSFTTVDLDPPQRIGGSVTYRPPNQPQPGITSVVNTASFQPFLSPSALVSIFGSYLATPVLPGTFDYTGSYPTTLGNTSVTFNGINAPLLYVSPGQINVMVPYALAGQTNVQVVVNRYGVSSPPFTAPLLDTSPAIFTAAQNGTGQGAIHQLEAGGSKGSFNSADNPASPGTTFEMYMTGAGVWATPMLSDVFTFFFVTTNLTPSLTIGGKPAKVLYAGSPGTPLQVWGLVQVNAVVPDGVPSGPQPLVLRIGQNDNAQQNVTIAIR